MGGQLSSIPAPDLGAMAIKEALKRAGVKPEQVDEPVPDKAENNYKTRRQGEARRFRQPGWVIVENSIQKCYK